MSTIQKEIKRYFDEPPHNTEKVTDIIKAIQEDFGLVAAMLRFGQAIVQTSDELSDTKKSIVNVLANSMVKALDQNLTLHKSRF